MTRKHKQTTTSAIVSVSGMAKMVGLSRARFYELITQGVFLPPVYSLRTRRPYFTTDMQTTNLEVRQTSIGLNGEYVMFYVRRKDRPQNRTRHSRGKDATGCWAGLIHQLAALGVNTNESEVEVAIAACFPNGIDAEDDSAVLRTVYRRLRQSGAT